MTSTKVTDSDSESDLPCAPELRKKGGASLKAPSHTLLSLPASGWSAALRDRGRKMPTLDRHKGPGTRTAAAGTLRITRSGTVTSDWHFACGLSTVNRTSLNRAHPALDRDWTQPLHDQPEARR